MTTGQLLLQSFYEDQDRAMRLGGLHHTSLSGPPCAGSPLAVYTCPFLDLSSADSIIRPPGLKQSQAQLQRDGGARTPLHTVRDVLRLLTYCRRNSIVWCQLRLACSF